MAGSEKSIETRKAEHIRFCLEKKSEFRKKSAGFEEIELFHCALPEISLSDIETRTSFLKKEFTMPFMIAPITGGYINAREINRDIARAAGEFGIGMALGSMKAMLRDKRLIHTYEVHDLLGKNLLCANIGGNDLSQFQKEEIISACENIDADILGIHLNPAQELIQPEGKTDFLGVLDLIKDLSSDFPCYVREVSSGISRESAALLSLSGVSAIDVGGAGGTSWTAVEYLRQGKDDGLFWDWGIPTAVSLREVKSATKNIPIIATGGIRSGLDIAKSIVLGAGISGAAAPILWAQQKGGYAGVIELLENYMRELRSSMFLCGAKNIDSLSHVRYVINSK